MMWQVLNTSTPTFPAQWTGATASTIQQLLALQAGSQKIRTYHSTPG